MCQGKNLRVPQTFSFQTADTSLVSASLSSTSLGSPFSAGNNDKTGMDRPKSTFSSLSSIPSDDSVEDRGEKDAKDSNSRPSNGRPTLKERTTRFPSLHRKLHRHHHPHGYQYILLEQSRRLINRTELPHTEFLRCGREKRQFPPKDRDATGRGIPTTASSLPRGGNSVTRQALLLQQQHHQKQVEVEWQRNWLEQEQQELARLPKKSTDNDGPLQIGPTHGKASLQ